MNKKLASIVAGLIFILAFSYCREAPKTKESSLYLNHSDSAKYVGIEACQACHGDKYQTFVQTGMGMSFNRASEAKSSANFKNNKPVYDTYKDLYYFPYFSHDKFFLKEYRLLGSDTIYSRTEEIKYIIGSGHHTNSHFTEENGYVFQAPITFYTQKGKWDLPPGFEDGNNTRFSRKIGLECMSCHNAIPNYVHGSLNKYEDLPHGIDCERCHGPGSIHVNEMKAGRAIDVSKHTDYTIVNPSKLSWQKQIDVCQRCHLQGNAVLKPGKEFTDFRPGMSLSTVFDQFSPEYDGGDEFVMAAHAERFQKSKCFINSVKGDLNSENASLGFTCISCHNPHVSVRQTNSVKFNNVCQSCHHEGDKDNCTEDQQTRALKNNNCVTCHMPSSGTSDIPHVTVHDHYIRIPDTSALVKGNLIGLRCVTSKQVDAQTETEAYISYYEKFDKNKLYLSQAKKKSKDLNSKLLYDYQTLIHLYYISGEYKKILEIQSNYRGEVDAWTNYRIANAYQNLGQLEQANTFFAEALRMEPQNLDFILQYAVLLIKQDQWIKAEKQLNAYNTLYSKTAETWAYLGLAAMKKNELGAAKKHFLKALSLDPDDLISLQNLKTLYGIGNESDKVDEMNRRIQVIQNKKIR
ncbi:MAG: tetratricopeptide repeat protein [Bacteroidia bacterium]